MTKRLIATDEAGYGPQLGPLVIAATCWDLPEAADMTATLADLEQGFEIPSLGRVRIGDSKKLFAPGRAGGLRTLEIAMLSVAACASSRPIASLAQWLRLLSPATPESLATTRWFANLSERFPIDLKESIDWTQLTAAVGEHWQTDTLQMRSASATILSAAAFNAMCASAGNKATLLSEQTVALVKPQILDCDAEDVEVFSDKHGGRAYYGSLLQHFFPEGRVSVETEGRLTSRYQVQLADRTIRWHFTAKGDTFAPVALASMIAKYTRERLMDVFNAYWQAQVPGLRPTAGYPGDARRFLSEIASAIAKQKLTDQELVRFR
ncbi:Hypothetical protein Poly24_24600 [Rosistilla carotiformis]|uniref:Ribonuclease HIII n=1 Tax=Rosistilla carotiformis TaxID=2528017 RepID=A0A518JT75_9BACT|nr:hypothetical protein [Rosistilla carotiformis]QDV68747.1 Hypothetical protein Poly24_24600 [Rosistilla carotiformis]